MFDDGLNGPVAWPCGRLQHDPIAPQRVVRWHDEFSRNFPKAIDRRYRIYCVSTKPDSELMWAHYATQHKGICLEFTSRSDLFFQALKVTYLRYYPVFDMADDDDNMPLMELLTKSRAWKYEDEYRLIAQERDQAPGAEAPLITDRSLLELPAGEQAAE